MKVRELIEILKSADPEKEVVGYWDTFAWMVRDAREFPSCFAIAVDADDGETRLSGNQFGRFEDIAGYDPGRKEDGK
ncbi:hypothetical protein [Burkholderia gladioli]|uniref:hypothetical protein n=1 Tax=Burkholderia gladioli TaxID=28095 RepID=UPI00163ED9A0|nr:hypothetical protein [Burkholderia gladioli]